MGPWAWGPGAPMGPMGPMGPMAWASQPMWQRLGRRSAKIARMILNYCFGVPRNMQNKADSTLRTSQAVPHPSTNRALRRLTSEVRRDPVHSTRYGRQRSHIYFGSSRPEHRPEHRICVFVCVLGGCFVHSIVSRGCWLLKLFECKDDRSCSYRGRPHL